MKKVKIDGSFKKELMKIEPEKIDTLIDFFNKFDDKYNFKKKDIQIYLDKIKNIISKLQIKLGKYDGQNIFIEKISKVRNHKFSDKLDVVYIHSNPSLQFVVTKGMFKVGDECAYYPVDYLMPFKTLEALKIWAGYFSLSEKINNQYFIKIKVCKIRKEKSYGILLNSY